MGSGDSRTGCILGMLLLVVGIGAGSAWMLSSFYADTDPWMEHDASIAGSLLGALGAEMHVYEQVGEVQSSPFDVHRDRFQAHLDRVRAAAGARLVGIGILDTQDGNKPLVSSGDVSAFTKAKGPGLGPPPKVKGQYVSAGGKELFIVSRQVADAYKGSGTLPAVAVVVIDTAVSPVPSAKLEEDQRGVLVAALLRALAEEYHVLKRVERVASGFEAAQEHERRTDTPAPGKEAKALDYLQRVQILDQRYAAHLGDARKVASTRCVALVVHSNDELRPEPILTTPDPGRFLAAKRFTLKRGGKATGIGIASGTILRRPALETRAQVRDRYSDTGTLPWTVHVWLNADPRQQPGR